MTVPKIQPNKDWKSVFRALFFILNNQSYKTNSCLLFAAKPVLRKPENLTVALAFLLQKINTLAEVSVL